ncbi:MAG: lactoylglutathione lyase [Pseudomonadota bacterium]
MGDIEGKVIDIEATHGYVMNQTMLRVRDPEASVRFYSEILGMSLLKRLDFPSMEFSLYFMGYVSPTSDEAIPSDARERIAYTFRQKALIELTHNWGTETSSDFRGYHNGNDEPQGFGHIGISVPDVFAACERFDALGVEFVKRPDEGKMRGLAFIKDPDGYWIEVLEANSLAELSVAMSEPEADEQGDH